jgi:archaemetzincin
LPAVVKGEVLIGAQIPAPASALDGARKQYVGEGLLRELERLEAGGADRVVGIIDADAYAPGLNFIFGQARKPGRVAVVALPRLRQSLRGRAEDAERFRSRTLKVTVHELGHTFGYAHCPDRTCVMHFANSVGEADAGGFQYCSRER